MWKHEGLWALFSLYELWMKYDIDFVQIVKKDIFLIVEQYNLNISEIKWMNKLWKQIYIWRGSEVWKDEDNLHLVGALEEA